MFRQRCQRRSITRAKSKADYGSEDEAIRSIPAKLGITSPESLRKWAVRQVEVDGGVRQGKTTGEIAEIRELKKQVAELRRANEILKSASAFFASARPPLPVLIDYVRPTGRVRGRADLSRAP